MYSSIQVRIYGKDKIKIYNDLGKFNDTAGFKTPSYTITSISDSHQTRFYPLIDFLENKKGKLSDLKYKIFFEENTDCELYSASKDKDYKKHEYYTYPFLPLIGFKQPSLESISATYHSTDVKIMNNRIIDPYATFSTLLGYDLDGILYSHYSTIEKIDSLGGLNGVNFINIKSTDEYKYTYPCSPRQKEFDNLAQELDLEYEPQVSLIYLTNEQFNSDKKDKLYEGMIDIYKKMGYG